MKNRKRASEKKMFIANFVSVFALWKPSHISHSLLTPLASSLWHITTRGGMFSLVSDSLISWCDDVFSRLYPRSLFEFPPQMKAMLETTTMRTWGKGEYRLWIIYEAKISWPTFHLPRSSSTAKVQAEMNNRRCICLLSLFRTQIIIVYNTARPLLCVGGVTCAHICFRL